jgi:hypothetical protein
MDFDLRLPIGILFTAYGVILTAFGAITNGSDIYKKSLGDNINLQWGIVLLVFGSLMLGLAMRAKKSSDSKN